MMITTLIGLAAATCTTTSYVPQLKKCWDTGRAEDLSKKMIMTLGLGIALWVVCVLYPTGRGDYSGQRHKPSSSAWHFLFQMATAARRHADN